VHGAAVAQALMVPATPAAREPGAPVHSKRRGRALAISENYFGPEHTATAPDLENLAYLLQQNGGRGTSAPTPL